MTETEVAVIGGGASGLMASIMSASTGADTIILEHMDRVGKKILATGNGKCNYTNEVQGLSCYRGEDPAFTVPVMKQFDQKKTVDFFRRIGIEPKIKNGYYYPASEQAASVLDVLRMEAAYTGVKEFVSCEIKAIRKQGNFFLIQTGRGDFRAKSIIFATGLFASPKSGSDGSALPYIEHFGHHIIDIVPALVPLQGKQSFFKMLAGIRAETLIKLYINGAETTTERGELQLTDYGISGIPIFQISRFATKALKQKKQVYVIIDFMPDRSFDEITGLLKLRFLKRAHGKDAAQAMIGLCNKKLAEVLLKEAGIDLHIPAEKVSEKQFTRLTKLLKGLHVDITGSKDIAQAQVCAGGVDTHEIDAESMMSKLVSGLFFAGEVVDIDGTCGGYNLQWAWSSGYVAGIHAAEYARRGKKVHKKEMRK